jgi:hypothetical protein
MCERSPEVNVDQVELPLWKRSGKGDANASPEQKDLSKE